MIPSLFSRNLKSGAVMTLVIFAVLSMYTTMIISMFDPEMGDSMAAIRDMMPTLFEAFGMGDAGTTLFSFMENYLYGFLYIVFPLVLILLLVNRLIVRHIDRGTLSCLLATPHSRLSVITTQLASLLLMLLVLIVALTAEEYAVAQVLFEGELAFGDLAAANFGLFGLWVFFTGVCALSACSFNRSGAALWVGGGVAIVSILIQMVSQVGDKFEDLKYATPLTLFDPSGLAASSSDAAMGTAVLFAAGLVLLAAAAAVFSRRNLSI